MTIENFREFNDYFTVTEVMQTLQGINARAGKGLICPFHHHTKNEPNAAITRDGKIFRCFSQNCGGDRGMFPHSYAEYYCREVLGISDAKEIAKTIDSYFNTSLYHKPKLKRTQQRTFKYKYDKEYKVDKYLSESIKDVLADVKENKTIVLQGGTGIGKTRALATGLKEHFNKLDVKKVLFVTPRSSIVEEISNRYNYDKFYKNNYELPNSDFIAATTHKARLLNEKLLDWKVVVSDDINNMSYDNYLNGLKQVAEDYLLVIDEAHLLLTSRNIVGDVKAIEELISKAKYCIFTSANTYHFYKACKERYGINKHISVKRKKKIYNMESLDFIRMMGSKEARAKEVVKIIEREENKVFVIYNNIEMLQLIEKTLLKHGIKTKAINAENKTDIDVIDSYNNLIVKSVLDNKVTLCTSVVDTGINIEESHITTIVIQDQHQLDDITINQAFARVRTTQGNKGILILQDIKELQEHHSRIKGFNYTYKTWKIATDNALNSFNMHMMNNMDEYEIESVYEFKTLWDMLKSNELYAPFKEILELQYDVGNVNPRLSINDVVLYNKARKENIRSNYFCDKFILNILKQLNVKKINSFKVECKIEEKQKNKSTFKEDLKELLEDKTNMQDLALLVEEKLDKDNLKNDDVTGFIKDYKKKINPILKRIRSILERCKKEKLELDHQQFIKDYLLAYTEEKLCDTKLKVKEIEYKIFNKLWKKDGAYVGIGVLEYEVIRSNCDCFLKSKHKPNRIAYDQMIQAIFNNEKIQQKAELTGKPVKINKKKCKTKIDEIIKIIYKTGKDLRLLDLA